MRALLLTTRLSLRLSVALGLIFGSAALSIAQEPAPPKPAAPAVEEEQTPEKQLAKKRLDLMTSRIGQVQVRSGVEGIDLPATFESTPIFRYDDPARGLVSAAVWRLGAKGRPLAIITTELQPRFLGKPRIVYEYLSLIDTPFTASSKDCAWSPRASEVTFKPIPGAPEPAENERQRLIQMRTEAKRFIASEVVKERYELRLVPQPIERYTPEGSPRADGSMFILAFGLNPEAILFIESDGKQWNYAIGRLAGASKMSAEIDGQVVWEVGPPKYVWQSSYAGSNAPADIPGIAPDGTPIKEEAP